MATKTQKVKVGIFLALNVVVFVVALMMLTDYKRGDRIRYWCEFNESILGLNTGAVVEYLGVPVGSVVDIWVTDRNTAHVELLVRADRVTLREGVEATLVLYSFATGVMYISLAGGDGPPLGPGAQIPTAPSLVEKLRVQTQTLLSDMAGVVGTINRGLEGLEDGQIARIVENTDGLISDARQVVADAGGALEGINVDLMPAVEDFRAALGDVRTLSKNLNRLVTTLNDKIDPLDLAQTGQEVQEAARQVAHLAERLQRTADALDVMADGVLKESSDIEFALRGSLDQLRDTLESVRDLAEYLMEDPASLVRGRGRREEPR